MDSRSPITFVVGVLIAAVLTPLVIRGLRRAQLVDTPNHRSSHSEPIPRSGGIAVAIATTLATLVGNQDPTVIAVAVGSLVVASVGLADDRIGLPVVRRLVAQAVVALGLSAYLLLKSQPEMLWILTQVVAAGIVIVGCVNVVNFMDGINGITSIHASIVGLSYSVLGARADSTPAMALGLAIAAASLGFLPHNLPRAKVFLGDVGSYFIGCWLAATFIVLVRAGVSIEVAAAPFLYYFMDSISTIFRRLGRRENITHAHRDHSYQRLVDLGWSHVKTTLFTSSVTGACAVSMLAASDARLVVRGVVFSAAAALAAAATALPFAIERARRGAQ